jgi:hypothetical protein
MRHAKRFTLLAGLAITAVVATGIILFQASPVLSASAEPASSAASTCADCCDGSLCQALGALADLRSTVVELVPQPGIANSLVAKVDAATSAVLSSTFEPALNQLGAFDQEITADEQSGKVSVTTGNLATNRSDTAKTIINNLR